MLQKAKRGFTLVEILIVVIILGILAAIVIPQFSGASQEAKTSSLVSTLQTLRSQILLYKLQHSDSLPDITTKWDALTATSTDPAAPGKTFGPYMQAAPKNPLNGLDTVTNATVTVDADTGVASWSGTATGFVYDYGTSGDGTGRIWGTNKDGTALAAE
ncbi:MAG TPA: prepilin-type N-terminal cleavage/methylation domain-containing protein [Tepidisphaeraceae bacterium]|nr:prepilin-type N-terminal cleavage/methylation domain-containing protein [Tepidisphaeraceae bacterium]